MNTRVVCVFVLVLGSCLVTKAQFGQAHRVRLMYGDYDCSCSYHCPQFAISAGPCHDSDSWGWGRFAPQYCCVPSYMDYDAPDMTDFGAFGHRVYFRK